MSGQQDLINVMIAELARIGHEIGDELAARLAGLPRYDVSGWYYIVAPGAALADGRPTATIKARAEPVGPTNKAMGPFPCLRSYTPVAGQRVLVRWVAGDRADGVIEG
jgi:hypothetical protein